MRTSNKPKQTSSTLTPYKMGLKDLEGLNDSVSSSGSTSRHSGRYYPDHERQDELEEWLEECKEAFPVDIEVDFIEVSTKMTQRLAMSYWDHTRGDRDRYIRVSEWCMDKYDDWQIKSIIMHELCHAWLFQNGDRNITERDPIFTYILGATGSHLSGYMFSNNEFKKYCVPFIDKE